MTPQAPASVTLREGTAPADRMQGSGRDLAPSETTFRLPLAVLWLLLVCAVVSILLYGLPYYVLPVTARYRSPLHAYLKPSGHLAHPLGICGGLMIVGLLLYSARKRVGFMKTWGNLGEWLQVHIFLGVAGPVLVTLHMAFKLHGIVAISYLSMILVALSGTIGRYIYAQIPRKLSGEELEAEDIRKQMAAADDRLGALLDPSRLRQLHTAADFRGTDASGRSSLRAILLMILDDVRWPARRRRIQRILHGVRGVTRGDALAICSLARRSELLQRRIALLSASHSLFKYWHVIHLPLAQAMYLTMTLHILVAVMTGYF